MILYDVLVNKQKNFMDDPDLQKLVNNGDIVSYKYISKILYGTVTREYCILTFNSGTHLEITSCSFYCGERNELSFREMDELEKTIHDYDSSFPYMELAMYLHNNKEKCRRHHDLTRLIYGFICDYSNNPLSDSWNLADRILYLDL
jgi:hypothetical protein